MKVFLYSIFVLALLRSQFAVSLDVQAHGLLKDAAILTINGRQQLLKVGKRSSEGVLLIEASPQQALIEIDGKRRILTLSRDINSRYNVAKKTELAIRRNDANQYVTNASINGIRTKVLVDTGANTMAMSSAHARSLGLDYSKGRPGIVRTASGEANAVSIILRSVDVGGIHVSGVQTFVIDGDFPHMILLGMTYLKHVDLREQNGILYIQSRF